MQMSFNMWQALHRKTRHSEQNGYNKSIDSSLCKIYYLFAKSDANYFPPDKIDEHQDNLASLDNYFLTPCDPIYINPLLLTSQQVDEIDEHLLAKFSYLARGDVSPMQAVIGSITAQEIVKACSGKFNPIRQWFYFDALECLPEDFHELPEVRGLVQCFHGDDGSGVFAFNVFQIGPFFKALLS